MSEIRRLRGQLRAAYSGPAWHGPALRELIGDVTPREADRRVAPGLHTILEIVLHAAAWKREVVRRVDGAGGPLPDDQDWPRPAQPIEHAWPAAVAELDDAHAALTARLVALRDGDLDRPAYTPEAGTQVSVYATLHGVIQHDVYHAGQIALLRKWIRIGDA
ncbi:MAG: DinB family protein [Gemmatimonadetes bacterium]|nr:DinB family protein [Gemmatimonadota bacterium]